MKNANAKFDREMPECKMQEPIVHYALFIVHYALFIVHYALFIVHC